MAKKKHKKLSPQETVSRWDKAIREHAERVTLHQKNGVLPPGPGLYRFPVQVVVRLTSDEMYRAEVLAADGAPQSPAPGEPSQVALWLQRVCEAAVLQAIYLSLKPKKGLLDE